MSLDVLYEDNHLLVINKPAGLVTQGASEGEPSAIRLAQDYLRQKYHKPGNVYVGVVSRLDSLVTGVLVLARTSKAAARLSEQFRMGSPSKIYWAIVEGAIAPPAGSCEDFLWKGDAQQRVFATSKPRADAQRAELTYRTLKGLKDSTMLEIELGTGRKHQIRVQLSSRGHPILGDVKYDARRAFPQGIALHARSLTIRHPVRDEQLCFEASLPPYWPAAVRAERFGGEWE